MALLNDYKIDELDYASNLNHRSGYMAILANQMIDQLSIITDKPQTTRHRILGICSGPYYQVFVTQYALISYRISMDKTKRNMI